MDPSNDSASSKPPGPPLNCSFCGKSRREVRKLIAGPVVYICNECIGLCNDIIAEEIGQEEGKKPETIRKLSSGMIEFSNDGKLWDLLNPRYILRVGWSGTHTSIKLVTEEIVYVDAPYTIVRELLNEVPPR